MLDKRYWKNKRVLITGGTGFIGTWMCLMLIELGAEVYALSRSGGNQDGMFVACCLNERVEVYKGDIRDKTFVIQTIEECHPDVVFHLAAQPIFEVANEHPFYTYEANILGTLNVIEGCRNTCTDKIVFITSNHWDGKVTDDISIYASSKACSEIVVRSLCKLYNNKCPSMSIVRMINVIGAGDRELSRIVPYCLDRLSKSEPINVHRPDAKLSFVYVIDAAIMLLSIAQEKNGSIWKLSRTAGKPKTVEDIKNTLIDRYSDVSKISPIRSRNFSRHIIYSGDCGFDYIHTPFKDAIGDTVYLFKLMGKDDLLKTCQSIVAEYINFASV